MTFLVEVSKDGLQISLSDGSVWNIINTSDISKTRSWVRKQSIQVKKNMVGDLVLTNIDTVGPDKIVARQI